MVTAETTFSREQLLSLRAPMTLFGIGWKTYEDISEELSETRSFHVTFEKGTLTIMPVSELHELLISLLDKFVTFAGMTLRQNIVSTGMATIRSKQKQIGVEPDLSYFVTKASVHRVKDYVAEELEMAPDIVVEIDVHRESNEKFELYAALCVSEFWLYQGDVLKMFRLNENGAYEQIERSSELTILTAEILTGFLRRGRNEEPQFEILTDFQEWLRNAE